MTTADPAIEAGRVVGRVAERLGLMTEAKFMQAFLRDRQRRASIERNIAAIDAMGGLAARVTVGPAGRCFVMPDGRLLTIRNEQVRGSDIEHIQAIVPLSREDAEDFYGYAPAVPE